MATLQTIQAIRKRRKKQRRAADALKLRGPRIDVEEIDYKNIASLQRLITAQGKMYSRKRTGLSASAQRKATLAIKRARFLALLPFVS